MMTRRMAILNCLAAIGSILVGWPAFAAPSRAMRLLDLQSPMNKLRYMNAVRYFNKLSHSIFSSKGNCCFWKFGESTFCNTR